MTIETKEQEMRFSTGTVNETIRRWPATVAVFGRYGIDACCGGGLPVLEAIERHGLDRTEVVAALERAAGEDG